MASVQDNGVLLKGRLTEPTEEFVTNFTSSVGFDYRLAEYDIAGSIAHVRMLARVDILRQDECDVIIAGLTQIKDEVMAGQFNWSVNLEDVHMNIEHRLIAIVGEVGQKLHTGRSRNDQIATDIRLFLRAEIDTLTERLWQLMDVLLALAEQYAAVIMPGFTHLQIAQPVTFGHHMMAWAAMLERDLERLSDCRNRVNRLPLGAAALAGTTFPIDREFVAAELDFSALCPNSLDAVSDRDFIIEFCAFGSVLLMHFSRWAEEIIIWMSAQFRFIELPDSFCTGSSIMPQKKNPDVPELVRGKSGRMFGHLIAVLTLMKSQPLAYNKDNQEDKEPLFDAVDTAQQCVQAFVEMLPHMKPDKEVMLAAVRDNATATDLAEYLASRGMPFRAAHEAVGQAIAAACGRDLSELSLAELQPISDLIGADIIVALTPAGSVAARDCAGGTAPTAVRAAVASTRARMQSSRLEK